MPSEESYKKLYSQLNIAMAKCRDLKEQLSQREEQWKQRDEEIEITRKLVRELCEMILAKDSSQMELGKSHSWRDIPVDDLIRSSKNVFKTYNANRNDILQKLADVAEDRRIEIEQLKEDLERMKEERMYNTGGQVEENKTQKKNANVSDLPPQMQDAANEGNIDVYDADQDAEKLKQTIINGKACVRYENNDEYYMGETEKKVHEANRKDNAAAKPKTQAVQSVYTQKMNEDRKKSKKNANLEQYKEYVNETMPAVTPDWEMLIEILGKTGKSQKPELYSLFMDEAAKRNLDIKSSKFESAIKDMINASILETTTVNTPFKPKFTLMRLTAQGAAIHYQLFNRMPEVCEWEMLFSEHSSLPHGYGILQCAEEIIKTKAYEKVDIYNRKRQIPVSEDNPYGYIPDIWCEDKNKKPTYIEYELGHYNKGDFIARCNKINVLSDHLNFIVPSKDDVDKMLERIKEWLATRGNSQQLKGHVIRVTPAKSIINRDLRLDNNWMCVLRIGSDKEFTINRNL